MKNNREFDYAISYFEKGTLRSSQGTLWGHSSSDVIRQAEYALFQHHPEARVVRSYAQDNVLSQLTKPVQVK